MRRVKIAACLLVLIVIYSVASLFMLKFYNGQLRGRLENIQAAYESGDKSKAMELSNELNVYWHEYEKAVTILVHDESLEEVNSSIARITPFISNDNSELIAEMQSVYNRLDRIYEEEFPTWYNIL